MLLGLISAAHLGPTFLPEKRPFLGGGGGGASAGLLPDKQLVIEADEPIMLLAFQLIVCLNP